MLPYILLPKSGKNSLLTHAFYTIAFLMIIHLSVRIVSWTEEILRENSTLHMGNYELAK